ncbi:MULTISPECIES: heterodisulfide reductase-related iron-sulfur binding cluster [unclassified Knoellia]|uniref:heterodisulfide reductase-related iron-sulfur binding cluster n=1 Tax=Knoellia altitudinis TaxID=3404795 RepID=UPI00360BF59F
MSALQIVAAAICFPLMLVGWALLFRQIGRFVALYRVGQADPRRSDAPLARSWTLAKEFLGHTRMARLPVVAVAHWFTALSFMLLIGTLINAFGQLIDPSWVLPVIGHFPPFEWMTELFAWGGLLGIIALIVVRQRQHPRSATGEKGRRSRFFGSNWWHAYYVELTILGVTLCILTLRVLEAALIRNENPTEGLALHFPLTGWLAGTFSGLSLGALETAIVIVATIKIIISFAWMITISLTPTMGVAWHRFLAFPNIWFKRESSGRTALGNLKPMTMGDGQPFSMEAMEAASDSEDEEAAEPVLGVGKVEDFTWKGLLDFSTCTECGRCQSQCPAWNTEKPLSPKLLVMALRDHANAKSPWLLASEEARASLPAATTALAEVPLIGETGYDIRNPLAAYNPHGPDAVIDQDVLWSCTTCGACVEQCPVDIEHVDHIVDMRRYQTLIESAFPSELGGLFKNLESKGNPWGMGSRARLDWAKDLPFEVKILGQDVQSASEVDYLFWVGCAGAYEDRAKKTTRAVAELLDTAGVSFAVLGDGETCTGDSARRAGNEILFSMLAQQNIETFGEMGVQKIVVTCAHCFNTIKNEYPDLGGTFEVVHHTQLLNRLVRDKKLVPVARPADVPGMSSAKNAASTAATVTYHDPCYLGRHNNVYAPPRELLGALPGVELREMERTKEKSFCCGAGGARMWMEEKLGGRINMNRTEEALATGAERIAIGCPFCRVMISDGLTAKQSEGVGEDVEVVDVAQMLLAAVRRGQEDTDRPAPADESAAAAVASESAEYAGQPASAPTAGASSARAVAGAGDAAATATAGTSKVTAADTSTPTAEADPWDEPATPTAAAPAPSTPAADADPWDEPDSVTDKAAASEGEPTPEKLEAAAAVSTDDVDPWDEPAGAAGATAPTATSVPAPADTAEQAATAAPGADDVDPWDEPATATPAAPAAETATAPVEADAPQAKPATPGESPATSTVTDDIDPWDEPAAPAAHAAESRTAPIDASTQAPATGPTTGPTEMGALAASAVTDDIDPWDEPVAVTPAAAEDSRTPVEAPAPENTTTDENATPNAAHAAPEASDDDATSASTESISPATADDLLSAPDPWDDADTLSERSSVTTNAAPEAAHTGDEPSVESTVATVAAEPANETDVTTAGTAEAVTEPEADADTATADDKPASQESSTTAKPANADDLLNAPDPWD